MYEKKHQRGFSMAEVLVAVALLSVILLALFGLVTAGVQRAYAGRKMTEATILAQAVMERANVESPQTLLGAVDADTTATRTWTLTTGTVTPATDTGSGVPVDERNAWRALLASSTLPARTGTPATLTVTMTPLPAGRNFGNAASVRVLVDVSWYEFTGNTTIGARQRTVRLQTLNVRSTNL
jgi:prepilin-type N-terminal cleavage/methylation domain-containing protein